MKKKSGENMVKTHHATKDGWEVAIVEPIESCASAVYVIDPHGHKITIPAFGGDLDSLLDALQMAIDMRQLALTEEK